MFDTVNNIIYNLRPNPKRILNFDLKMKVNCGSFNNVVVVVVVVVYVCSLNLNLGFFCF